jgi:membrane protein involved in colicin uptake
MKRTVFGIVLMGVMGAGSLFAQNGYRGYDHDGDGRRDRQDIRQDYQRIQRQQNDLYRDQGRLRHELREGDYREAQRIRQDMWRDQQRLQNQRQDVRRDWRDRDRDRDRRDRW